MLHKYIPLLILLQILQSNSAHPNLHDNKYSCLDSSNYFICNNNGCVCAYFDPKEIFSLILRTVSPIFTIVLILGFFLVKKLRQQPGDFFLGFAIGEVALFIISNLERSENNKPGNSYGLNTSEDFCFGIALSKVFFRRAIRLYHICFMIYYLKSLQSSLKASKISTTFYHTIPWLTALFLTVLEIKRKTLGKALTGVCGLRSSAESGRYSVDLIMCMVCLIVTVILIIRFSSRYRNLGPATKRLIRYYMSYFVFANVFLFIPFLSKLYSSVEIKHLLESSSMASLITHITEIFKAEYYSTIYIDICSPIILTIIRLFDPSIGKHWTEFFRKLICCCSGSRRDSRKFSELAPYIEFDRLESRSITLTLKANDITALIEKSSFIDQVQYNSRVQVVYSLLSAIHYHWKFNPRRKSTIKLSPKDDAYYNSKAKSSTKHQITDKVIEENIPEIMEEVRSRNQTILPGKLTVHASEVFEEIARLDGIGSSLIDSLDLEKNCSRILKSGNADGGRSGEFFFFSNDNTLIIKTISTKELKVLLKTLPRFLGHFKRNPNSIIAKIYAAFTFEVKNPYEKYHLILMRNINGCPSLCTERKYDLKGATVDRSVLQNAEARKSALKNYGTMKDIDFDKYEAKINILEEAQNMLLDTIVRDVSFLRMEALIDYSLAVYLVNKSKLSSIDVGSGTSLDNNLFPSEAENEKKGSLHIEDGEDIKRLTLGTRPKGSVRVAHPLLSIKSSKENLYYHVGIIDYLTQYDWKKRCEKFYKQMKAFNFNLDTSCQDPHTYNRRFLGYMEKIILEDYADQANQSILL